MNYINQINTFWDKVSETPDVKSSHIVLYLALLNINNRCNWKPQFKADYTSILQSTRLDRRTYYKACQFLYDKGFLSYYSKGRNQFQSATFEIRVLEQKSPSEVNPLSTRSKSDGNILKHINNKTIETSCKRTQLDFDEIKLYFKEKSQSEEEALKFFEYNKNKHSGREVDWKPLADSWISRLPLKKTAKHLKSNSNLIPKGTTHYVAKF